MDISVLSHLFDPLKPNSERLHFNQSGFSNYFLIVPSSFSLNVRISIRKKQTGSAFMNIALRLQTAEVSDVELPISRNATSLELLGCILWYSADKGHQMCNAVFFPRDDQYVDLPRKILPNNHALQRIFADEILFAMISKRRWSRYSAEKKRYSRPDPQEIFDGVRNIRYCFHRHLWLKVVLDTRDVYPCSISP